jgi:hypothetical protein
MASASSTYAWERDRYGWEQNEFAMDGSDDEEYDCRNPTPEQAGENLSQMLLAMLSSGKLCARDVCVLAHWAHFAGAVGDVDVLKYPPDAQTGSYQRHLDRALRFQERKGTFYYVRVPAHDQWDLGRSLHNLAACPAHELLHAEFVDNPDLASHLANQLRTGNIPPNFKSHAVVVNNPGELVFPLSLYLDGVQVYKKEGMLVITIMNLVSGQRHLLCTVRRSLWCRCGCRGWCTLYTILMFVAWSISSLARGTFPDRRHDQTDFNKVADAVRRTMAGKSLGFKGAVVQIRADWAELAHTLGLPTWKDKAHPCPYCTCSSGTMLSKLRHTSSDFLPWLAKSHSTYEQACDACEVVVDLNRDQWLAVKRALFWDKRENGGRGRCLMYALPALHLEEGDRLEPTPAMIDVADFDSATTFPLRAVFWRRTSETAARHRAPIFSEGCGVTIEKVMAIDSLRTLSLGVFKVFVGHVFWKILQSDVFGIPSFHNASERHQLILLRLRAALFKFYSEWKDRCPGQILSQVSDLTLSMLGNKSNPVMGTKGAETEGLLAFVVHFVTEKAAEVDNSGPMIAAGQALLDFNSCIRSSPQQMTEAQIQAREKDDECGRRCHDKSCE